MILQLELTREQMAQLAAEVARINRMGKADTYSVKEVAEMLGVNVTTVRRRIEAKVIPTIPNIGRVRIPAAFVDKMVNPNPGA